MRPAAKRRTAIFLSVIAAFAIIGGAASAQYHHGPGPRPPAPPVQPPSAVQQQIQQQQMMKSATAPKSASRLSPVAATLAADVNSWRDFGSLSDEELVALFKEMGLDLAVGTGFSGAEITAMIMGAARAEGATPEQMAAIDAMLRQSGGAMASTIDRLQGSAPTDLARAFRDEYAKTCMCDAAAFASALGKAETRVIQNGEKALLVSLGMPADAARGSTTVVYDRNDDEIRFAGSLIDAGGAGGSGGGGGGGDVVAVLSPEPGSGGGNGSESGSDSSPGPAIPPESGGGSGSNGAPPREEPAAPPPPPIEDPVLPVPVDEPAPVLPPRDEPAPAPAPPGPVDEPPAVVPVPGERVPDGPAPPGGPDIPAGTGASEAVPPGGTPAPALIVRDDRIVVDEKGNVVGKIVPPNLGGNGGGKWEIIDPITAMPVREFDDPGREFSPGDIAKLNDMKIKDRKDQLLGLADVRNEYVKELADQNERIEDVETKLGYVKEVGSKIADYLAENGKGPIQKWGEGLKTAYELADSYGENLGKTGNQIDALIGMVVDKASDKISGKLSDKIADKVGGKINNFGRSKDDSNLETLDQKVVSFFGAAGDRIGEAAGGTDLRVIAGDLGRSSGESLVESAKEGGKSLINDPIKSFLNETGRAATGTDGSGQSKGIGDSLAAGAKGASKSVGEKVDAATKQFTDAKQTFDKVMSDPMGAAADGVSAAGSALYDAGTKKVSAYVEDKFKGAIQKSIGFGASAEPANIRSTGAAAKVPAVL